MHYRVKGQVFFASADILLEQFDVRDVAGRTVRIDLSQAHFWDITAVAALHKVRQRLAKHGSAVELLGLNAQSQGLMERLAVQG